MEFYRLLCIRLASEGFGAGDPEKIELMPTDWVLDMWEFANFKNEYNETAMELNKVTP